MMTPLEALQLALSKEIEAAKIYEQFSVKHPAIKELFLLLMNEEQKHKKLIEDKIREMSA